MNSLETAQLHKFITENGVEDVTEQIRANMHSSLIRKDIKRLYELVDECKASGADIDDCNCEGECMFLFSYYTDIFNRVKKDKLDRDILSKFIDVLEEIEQGSENQHSAAHKVGKYLKELYIDSALREANQRKRNEDDQPAPQRAIKALTYTQFKKKRRRGKLD